MKSLREVELTIAKTDCKSNLRDGLSRSMPILTKDENGEFIDNFFMYATDIHRKSYSTPIAIFGIYSDEKKAAYNRSIPMNEIKSIVLDEPVNITESTIKARNRFEELFPTVREYTYSANCSDEQKETVKEYVSCLETFSGPVVWKFYQELFPSFFEWAQNL